MPDRHDEWLHLYARRRRALAAYAIALVGAQEAEDVLHDAMVKLVRGRTRPDDPEAYAFRTIRTCAMDRIGRLAREGRERVAVGDGAFLDERSAPDPERAGAVRAALERLSERQRETVLLKIWCGLTLAQIAQATGRPLGTVASDHSRALDAMRPTLAKEMRHDA